MDAEANVGGRSFGTRDLMEYPLTPLTVPVRDVAEEDSGITITAGFRQNMCEGELDGVELSVDTGAGLGTDFIILSYGDRTGVLRGTEILRAWIASFDADAAAAMEGVRHVGR